MNQTNEGNFEVTPGIADRSVAATRIPAQEAVFRERHASERLESLGEGEVLGKGCDHVCSSEFVQNLVGLSKEMCIGLTVSAITDASAHSLGVSNVASQSTALASQWMGHVSSLPYAAHPAVAMILAHT